MWFSWLWINYYWITKFTFKAKWHESWYIMHHYYHYIQHTYSLNHVALENLFLLTFLATRYLTRRKNNCLCTRSIQHLYGFPTNHVWEGARYCQSLVDKLIFFWLGIVILDRYVQWPRPFFRTKRTQAGHGRYVFPNHFAILIHGDRFSMYAC